MEISVEDIHSFLRRNHIFAGLNDEELASAAGRLDVFSAPAGEVIYYPGQEADGVYFLFQGKVRVAAPAGKGTGGVSRVLVPGDIFGEEALVYGQERLVEASTRSEAVLLRASKRALDEWMDEFPSVVTPLRLAHESFFLVHNRSFGWLARGEKVQYASRRTRFILWKKLLAPAALLSVLLTLTVYLALNGGLLPAALTAFLLVLLAPWAAWLYFDWKNDFLVVTNRRIVTQEKVILLYDTRQETPLEAVQAFGIETDQWGRWFGYGTIVVRSFTGNQYLKEIESPNEVIRILEEALARAHSRRKEEDLRAAESAVKARLGFEGGAPVVKGPAGQESFFEAGVLPGWAAGLFQMRTESGDTITYRTHWIKLIQSIFLPILVLVLLPPALAAALGLDSLPLPVGTLIPFCVIAWALALGVLIYRFIDWHNDCYIISPDQVVDVYRKPLGMEERRTASYASVLGIEFTRKGLAGLIFNYGTVLIKVGDSNFTFDNVYNPSLVQQELFQKLNKFRSSQKKAADEAERQRMADFIESYHHLQNGGGNLIMDDEED